MKNYIILGAIVLVAASGLMFYEISEKLPDPTIKNQFMLCR